MNLLDKLLDLLFPPKCPFCAKLLRAGETDLCGACQRELPWLSDAAAEQRGEFFTLCVSPLRYRDGVRDGIHRYKFGGRDHYARAFGTLVAQCAADHLADQALSLVTWPTLSKRRLRKRGYDQAELLARRVGEELGLPVVKTLRKGHRPAQSGIQDAARRRANVLGAYEVLDPAAVAGKRVLLVDDVVTSGATLSECARVLRTAGAEAVCCATLARAGK